MFTIVRNENNTIMGARIVPKGSVVIQHWNRDTWVIRRDEVVRVFIRSGTSPTGLTQGDFKKNGGHLWPPPNSSLGWVTRAGQEFEIELPAFDWKLDANGGSAKYISSAIYDSIVYGNDDVVWFEQAPPTEDERTFGDGALWLAVGNTADHKAEWPELIMAEMP